MWTAESFLSGLGKRHTIQLEAEFLKHISVRMFHYYKGTKDGPTQNRQSL